MVVKFEKQHLNDSTSVGFVNEEIHIPLYVHVFFDIIDMKLPKCVSIYFHITSGLFVKIHVDTPIFYGIVRHYQAMQNKTR